MDCHDSANAESRNDGKVCFKDKFALWTASPFVLRIPCNDTRGNDVVVSVLSLPRFKKS